MSKKRKQKRIFLKAEVCANLLKFNAKLQSKMPAVACKMIMVSKLNSFFNSNINVSGTQQFSYELFRLIFLKKIFSF